MSDACTPSSATNSLLNTHDATSQSTSGAEDDHTIADQLQFLELKCSFPPEDFMFVMLNLIKNPNITSSLLFRADILLDQDSSASDKTAYPQAQYKPRPCEMPPEWKLDRTIVRKLIPRNTQLDRHLVQTCHFLSRLNESLVVYIPHVDDPEEIPFYHPKAASLSFCHRWQEQTDQDQPGMLTLEFTMFKGIPATDRLHRTGLKLLETIHKHGQGRLTGYEKRVHHDQVVDQKTYQDTYAKLKIKHGKYLTTNWQEVTDPGKHVFEDIAIAAFLIELWNATYRRPGSNDDSRPAFPGFVDIGCGNGVLTYILASEGYSGYGFDARRRKTWSIFPEAVDVRQQVLVPRLFGTGDFHDGVFKDGTFIISNHADELTAWTPLLAYLCRGSFIAIPCCSHDLAGARFRAPMQVKSKAHTRLPQQIDSNISETNDLSLTQAAETGSLKRALVQKKLASAYASLCSYVESLALAVEFEPEREVLRIPSTRNHSIIGRMQHQGASSYSERGHRATLG